MPPSPPDPQHSDAVADAWFSATVYSELHGIAERQLAEQRADHTLQPTALVNEAYLKIARLEAAGADGRRQFFALAGAVMRSVLVDHARRRQARKRDGGQRNPLSTSVAAPENGTALDVLALHEALERLSAIDSDLVRIVELKFFAGLGDDETAEILGVSSRTIRRGWRTAQAWLRGALTD